MSKNHSSFIHSTPLRHHPPPTGDESLAKFVLLKSTAQEALKKRHKSKLPGGGDALNVNSRREFYAVYCGFVILDKFVAEIMLPWIVAETALFKPFGGERVYLKFSKFDEYERMLKVFCVDSDEVLFEHRVENVLRVLPCFLYSRCFAYFTRSDPEFPTSCYVFQAVDKKTISDFYAAFQRRVKVPIERQLNGANDCNGDKTDNDNYVPCFDKLRKHSVPLIPSEPLSNYSQFEVLFVCRVELNNQKMTSVIVDNAVDDYKLFNAYPANEFERCQALQDEGFFERRRHSVDSGVSSVASPPNFRTPPRTKFSNTLLKLGKNAFVNDTLDSVFEDIYCGNSNDDRFLMENKRPRAYSSTRAMILLIGRYDICLLSLDRKMILLRKKFKRISRLVKGFRHSDHFGFVCPDIVIPSQSDSYVLRCQSKEITLNIMQTIKTAFQSAYNEETNHLTCDSCPMRQYAKLCSDLEGLDVMRSHELILQRIGQLQAHDQEHVWTQYKKLCKDGGVLDDIPEETLSESDDQMTKENAECPSNINRRNVALMSVLRSLCENEQASHIHCAPSAFVSNSAHNFNNNNEPLQQPSVSHRNLISSYSATKQFPEIHLCSPMGDSSSKGNGFQNDFGSNINLRPSSPTNKFLELRDRARHSLSSSLDSFIKTLNSSDSSPTSSPSVKMVCHFDTPGSNCSASEEEPSATRPRSSTIAGDFGYRRSQNTPTKPGRSSVLDKLGVVSKERLSSFCTSFDASTSSSASNNQRNGRRMSWRQAIFSRVVSPRMFLSRHSIANVNNIMEGLVSRRSSGFSSVSSPLIVSPLSESQPKTPIFYRSMWKKVIMDQILMIRIERQKKLQGAETEALRRLKLNYEEITPCSEDEARPIWTAFLNHANRQSTRFDRVQIEDAVKCGIPKDLRSEVWRFLLEQHSLDRLKRAQTDLAPGYRYRTLLKDLTSYQHAILIDLGRTFPGHPYFAQPLGSGQLSLFNILKAYSLYDSDVGYCQGLSFIAGLLLLHMEEEQAFDVIVDLLYRLGLRKQYRPDMAALQVEMYQLSRLLHDKHKDLHEHLEEHEIPILYAAPWFLTLFASAFPLGFVARVFDFVFLAGGLEVVFKIALVLLGEHKELIKHCDSFEAINEFLKSTLPSMSIIQMERIFNLVADMDITRELLAYEVEYHVLQEEVLVSPVPNNNVPNQTSSHADIEFAAKLETANKTLKRQNLDLLEKLQQLHSKLNASESSKKDMESKLDSAHNNINSYKCKVNNLENRIETLELERKSLLTALQRLRSRFPTSTDNDLFLCDLPNGAPSSDEFAHCNGLSSDHK